MKVVASRRYLRQDATIGMSLKLILAHVSEVNRNVSNYRVLP